MFYIQFFKRNRLRMVSDMSEKSCYSMLTTRSRHGNLQIPVLLYWFCDYHLKIMKERIEDNSSFWIKSRLTFFRVCKQIFPLFYCNIRFPNQKRFALAQYDNFSWGILLRINSEIVVPWEILHVFETESQLSAWLMLSTSMSMTWRPLTYLRTFSFDFSFKIGCKTCVF